MAINAMFLVGEAGLRLRTTSVQDAGLDSPGNSGTFSNTAGMDYAD